MAEAGLTMKVGFEHEFSVRGLNQVAHPAYSVTSGRAVSQLAAQVMQTLTKSGMGRLTVNAFFKSQKLTTAAMA